MAALRESAERLARIAARVSAHVTAGSESAPSAEVTPYPRGEGSERAMRVLRREFIPVELKGVYNRFRTKYRETFEQCAHGTQFEKIFYIYWFMRTVRNFAEYIAQRFRILLLEPDHMYGLDAAHLQLVPLVEVRHLLWDDQDREPINLRVSALQGGAWNRSFGGVGPVYEINEDPAGEARRMITEQVNDMIYMHRCCYRREALVLQVTHGIMEHVEAFWASNIFTVDMFGAADAGGSAGRWQSTEHFIKTAVLARVENVRKEASEMVVGIEDHLRLQGRDGFLQENENDVYCLRYEMPAEFRSMYDVFQKYSISLLDSCYGMRERTPATIRQHVIASLESCLVGVLQPLLNSRSCIIRVGGVRGGLVRESLTWEDEDGVFIPLVETAADTYIFVYPGEAARMMDNAIYRNFVGTPQIGIRIATAVLTSCARGDLVLTAPPGAQANITFAEAHVRACIADIETALAG